jgi:hypothetical protein
MVASVGKKGGVMGEEDRDKENLVDEEAAASDSTEAQGAAERDQGDPPKEPSQVEKGEENKDEEEDKSPAYGLWFACAAIGVGLVAYVATLIAFGSDHGGTAVTGALGVLFTLIGTVAGAYFGIKKSSDTEDKANKRVQEANRIARNAAGAMDPNTWKNL